MSLPALSSLTRWLIARWSRMSRLAKLTSRPGGIETIRGTSSGYVGYSYTGDDGLWRYFAAVNWHGGVDFSSARMVVWSGMTHCSRGA